MANEPELRSIFDQSTCVRKGLCPVTELRNRGDPLENHSLYFEQHGTGPEKIVFIMGYVGGNFQEKGKFIDVLQNEQQFFLLVSSG